MKNTKALQSNGNMGERPKFIPLAKKFFAYLGKEKRRFLCITVLTLIGTMLGLIVPDLIADAIDIIPQIGGTKVLRDLVTALMLIMGLYVIQGLLSYAEDIISSKFSLNIVTSMREDFFKKLSRVKISYLETCRHGDIVSRGANDIEALADVAADTTMKMLANLVIFVGCLVIMMLKSWQLTLISLASAAVVIIATLLISGFILKHSMSQQRLLGKMNAFAEDYMGIISTIKIFGREKSVIKSFEEISNALNKEGIACMKYISAIAPINNLMGNLNFVLIAMFGGVMAATDMISVGTIIAFILYVRLFTETLNEFSEIISEIQTAFVCADRFFEFMDAPQEDIEKDTACIKDGEIEFNNVSFSYVKNKPVLKNINMHIKAGERIAIVGKSGCGKTTMMNILLKYYDIDSGKILIDGTNIEDIAVKDLRQNIVAVMQDDFIFDNDLKFNLQYGKNDDKSLPQVDSKTAPENEEIDKYIRFAEGDRFKFDLLSEGQAQIICVLRAFYISPKIIIFDESMSSVDTATQRKLNELLTEYFKDSTIVRITHRLDTITNSDRIFYLDNGTIVESGKHDQLLAERGSYYNLYNKYLYQEMENNDAI